MSNYIYIYTVHVTLPDLIGEHPNSRVVDHERDIERTTEEQKFGRHFDFWVLWTSEIEREFW